MLKTSCVIQYATIKCESLQGSVLKNEGHDIDYNLNLPPKFQRTVFMKAFIK
jgi:hypothetical protein